MRGGAVVARQAQFRKISMDTKLKGDIAEQAAVLQALKRGWGVLKPIGDRLPYDLVFDIQGKLARIQVKCAWFAAKSQNYVVDTRRTKTNRRIMKRELYSVDDFDFALVYLPDKNMFYVFPTNIFIAYGSDIHLVETEKRQRPPRSIAFRDAWNLILQWATPEETQAVTLVKFGEASCNGNPEPNPALSED